MSEVATADTDQGFFSLLRWRREVGRDEAKNVAVILVDHQGRWGGVKAAPISAVSQRLREQGILDQIVHGLAERFEGTKKPTLGMLREWQGTMQNSLYLTEPRPTAVSEPVAVLDALYRAYVRPRGGGGSRFAKGRVLDRVISAIRSAGSEVRRGEYYKDFLFDAVVSEHARPTVVDTLSFASQAKTFSRAEYEAGHFLYARERVDSPGIVVVQEPLEDSPESALASFNRVGRWFKDAAVPVVSADHLDRLQEVLSSGT